jgi:microcystin-dependent protein
MAVEQPFEYVASVWSFGERSTINAGVTRYLAAPGGTVMASELAVVMVNAGTLKNLRWSSAASTLNGAGSRLTLYLNGAATPLVATWNGTVKAGVGTPDLVTVAPGDIVSVRIQLAIGTGNITRPRASVELAMPSSIPWHSDGKSLVYGGVGKVGIGTSSPREKLSVNGTIESTTGGVRFPDTTLQTTAFTGIHSVIPPGSVIAYAGPTPPAGWLLCDGSLVDRAAFPELFAAIGTCHGEGDASTTFAIPDYRGQFLRGVSGLSGMDPDAGRRAAPATGGSAGNAVGSKQESDTQRHSHVLGIGTGDSYSMALATDPAKQHRLASFRSDVWNDSSSRFSTDVYPPHTLDGNETRPRNVYVNYLIKA